MPTVAVPRSNVARFDARTVVAADLSYGIEIESGIPSAALRDFEPGGYHSGIQIPVMPTGWRSEGDGSITRPPGCTAAELVSPVLQGESGLVEVVYLADYLTNVGARFNDTMGVHVHVDARNLTDTHINTIKRNFVRYERAFYGLSGSHGLDRWNGPSRGRTNYCAHSGLWPNQDGNRYHSLNLQNYYNGGRKKTVEFRVWQATADPLVLVTAVSMAVALVARAVRGVAEDGPQIATAREAARKFARSHWSGRTEYRIVAGVDMTDLTRTLFGHCDESGL